MPVRFNDGDRTPTTDSTVFVSRVKLLLNLSRVPQVGGLRVFAESVLSQLRDRAADIAVVAPRWMQRAAAPFQVEYTPDYLASSASTSRMRPIAWWFYSVFCFPAERDLPMLCLTHHVAPFRRRQAVTVHDLRPFYAPDSAIQAFYFRWLLPRALRKCDGVITVSETSRLLLQKEYGIPAHRIYVVHNSVDLKGFQPSAPARRTSDPFLLMVGASWTHKNAEEMLRNACLWSDKYRLVIICGNPEYQRRLQVLAASVGASARVEFRSAIEREKLLWYYQNCAALVYPSRMEGFGLPPLEAMACGAPVILSDIPVFRELYGDDVPIYVTLGDESSWAEAFALLENQGAISAKVEKGLFKSREYDIARTKTELLQAITGIWGRP